MDEYEFVTALCFLIDQFKNISDIKFDTQYAPSNNILNIVDMAASEEDNRDLMWSLLDNLTRVDVDKNVENIAIMSAYFNNEELAFMLVKEFVDTIGRPRAFHFIERYEYWCTMFRTLP
jgi:hypothetical protein